MDQASSWTSLAPRSWAAVASTTMARTPAPSAWTARSRSSATASSAASGSAQHRAERVGAEVAVGVQVEAPLVGVRKQGSGGLGRRGGCVEDDRRQVEEHAVRAPRPGRSSRRPRPRGWSPRHEGRPALLVGELGLGCETSARMSHPPTRLGRTAGSATPATPSGVIAMPSSVVWTSLSQTAASGASSVSLRVLRRTAAAAASHSSRLCWSSGCARASEVAASAASSTSVIGGTLRTGVSPRYKV